MPPLTSDGLPNPQVLFCGLSSPDFYPRPLFSQREVFCGPDCRTVTDGGGFVSIATPVGSFDMAALVAQLPAYQKPELIVVKADATRRNLARNLDRIPCPKLLLVGDTHHLAAPIRTLLEYATVENFDAIIVDHTRHHAHFFIEAGFDRVYWIPSLDYALRRRDIPVTPAHALTFVGQIGAFHPYRRHVLTEVARAGLPLKTLRGSPEEAADLYAASAITLNCSLNGDLNLRVFEALGGGGFLITDALSPDSGLERLFTPGRHLVTYRSPGELVETIRHYLDHPEEAWAIRKAGQAHLLETQSPAVKRAQLYSLLGGGPVDPALVVTARPAPRSLPGRGHAFRHRVAAYEAVQHLHLRASRLSVLVEPGDPLGIAAAADLPRAVTLELGTEGPEAPLLPPPPDDGAAIREERVAVLPWSADALAAGEAIDQLLAETAVGFAIAGGPGWGVRSAMAARLAEWGFAPVEGVSELHRCTDRFRFVERSVRLARSRTRPTLARERIAALLDTVATPDQAMTAARLAQALGDGALMERCVHHCVALDRNHDDGLRVLAALADAADRPGDAWMLTIERLRARGLPPGAAADAALPGAPDLDRLERRAASDPRIARYRALTTLAPSAAGPKRRVLVITNLFPPQEFGGYGRKLWEFSAELLRRGHDVRILTADVPDLARPGMAGTGDLESRVERELELYGFWRNGSAVAHDDRDRCVAIVRENVARILAAVSRHGSELCLAGNLDLIGHHFLAPLIRQGVPVVHCLGNQNPGYAKEDTPTSPLYRPGPASRWVEERLKGNGFGFAETTVLHPGARVDYFYRPVMPALDRLRIAFAGLYVVYKGPQVLLSALNLLHHAGIDFECVMAGEAPDADLLERSRAFCERNGLSGKVRFQGFLDRRGMVELFARSNVLVFPSVFQEPFGISQVEAMAAGLTVVTSATGGSGEIVRHGIDGLHFASENHEDLAAKLRGLVADRDGWARLAQAGRSRAFEFAVGRSVDRIEAVFIELLEQGGAGACSGAETARERPSFAGLCDDADLMAELLAEDVGLPAIQKAAALLDTARWTNRPHPKAVETVATALAATPPAPSVGPARTKAARSLAALLLAPPYAWTGLSGAADMPMEACERYSSAILAAPVLFRDVGEADAYAAHTLTTLPAVVRDVVAETDPERKWALLRGATSLSLVPLYFNAANLMPALRARSALYQEFLRAHGLDPDWTPAPRSGGRIRIGILAAALVPRPETFAVMPLIEHPPAGADVTVYGLEAAGHSLEAVIGEKGGRFKALSKALNQQLDELRADDLDVLFFASNITAVLHASSAIACCRVARVQVSSVASVLSSGSPHVDWYISGAFNENAPDAAAQYSERLFRLPGTAHCFLDPGSAPTLPERSRVREELGIPQDAVVFGSTANVNKIIPDLQEVWSGILARVDKAVLLLMPYGPHWSRSYPEALFQEGFRQRLRSAGVDDRRLVIISERGWDRHDVRRALGAADIYLDSFPFSGSTSLIEPLELGLPIVCRAGDTFRGQMGAAMLRDLDCTDLIAGSDAAYIETAVALAGDPDARRAAAERIGAAFARPPRFKDAAGYAAAVYDALATMVDGSRTGTGDAWIEQAVE